MDINQTYETNTWPSPKYKRPFGRSRMQWKDNSNAIVSRGLDMEQLDILWEDCVA